MKFWLATNKDGCRYIHVSRPDRCEGLVEIWTSYGEGRILVDDNCFEGDEACENQKWEDEPIEIEVGAIFNMEFNA